MVVPLEYRSAGCPPASWFIDDLMRHLGQPYYVGLLSAAAIHGAAHQQPMVFQVVTDRPTRAAGAGRSRIEFHVKRSSRALPVLSVQTETGTMRVATPELTAFDLVRYPAPAGHLGNVVTVLEELAEKLDAAALGALASAFRVPDVQRLGYLLERVGHGELTDPLASWLLRRRYRPIPLRTRKEPAGQAADRRWRVIPNEHVEADL